MDRLKDILIIIFALIIGYQVFFKKVDTFEEENKALNLRQDSLLYAYKINQLTLDSLDKEEIRIDTLIQIKIVRQSNQSYADHQKIIAIDNLSNDSIYKLLTARYIN